MVTYFRAVLFCSVTGNADAHLKNWSLHKPGAEWRLMPLYDLVSTRLVIPEHEDKQELCLTLAGRHQRFTWKSFEAFAKTCGLSPVQAVAQAKALHRARAMMERCIENSFLPQKLKPELRDIIVARLARLA